MRRLNANVERKLKEELNRVAKKQLEAAGCYKAAYEHFKPILKPYLNPPEILEKLNEIKSFFKRKLHHSTDINEFGYVSLKLTSRDTFVSYVAYDIIHIDIKLTLPAISFKDYPAEYLPGYRSEVLKPFYEIGDVLERLVVRAREAALRAENYKELFESEPWMCEFLTTLDPTNVIRESFVELPANLSGDPAYMVGLKKFHGVKPNV